MCVVSRHIFLFMHFTHQNQIVKYRLYAYEVVKKAQRQLLTVVRTKLRILCTFRSYVAMQYVDMLLTC